MPGRRFYWMMNLLEPLNHLDQAIIYRLNNSEYRLDRARMVATHAGAFDEKQLADRGYVGLYITREEHDRVTTEMLARVGSLAWPRELDPTRYEETGLYIDEAAS